MKQVCKFSEVAVSVLDSLLPKREGRRQKANVGCYKEMSLLRIYTRVFSSQEDGRIKQIYNAVVKLTATGNFCILISPLLMSSGFALWLSGLC